MAEEPMGTRRNVADALREKRERRKKAAAVAAEEIPGVTPATSSTPVGYSWPFCWCWGVTRQMARVMLGVLADRTLHPEDVAPLTI